MTTVYLIFGKQGSGKTTQGQELAGRLNIPYFEAGDALRHLSKHDTKQGRELKNALDAGKLAPNYILSHVFDQFIKDNNCGKTGFVTDGFPRTMVQTELLEEMVKKYNWQVIAINIYISDEIAKNRLAQRVTILDGKEIRRKDDQPEIVEKRLENYRQISVPVIEWVRHHHQVLEVDGEQSPEKVTEIINLHIPTKAPIL